MTEVRELKFLGQNKSKSLVFLALLFSFYSFPLAAETVSDGGTNACWHWFKKVVEAVQNAPVYLSKGERLTWKLSNDETRDVYRQHRVYARLGDIYPRHLITTKQAEKKTAARAEVIRQQADRILKEPVLSFDLQRELLPSQVVMTAVQDRHGNFVLKEGNGRFFAIKEALKENPDMLIEILVKDHGGSPEVLNTLDEMLAASKTSTPPRTSLPKVHLIDTIAVDPPVKKGKPLERTAPIDPTFPKFEVIGETPLTTEVSPQ